MAQIIYCEGDIFTSPAQVLVNPVNCQGVMGKGLALEFKKRYPEMFRSYQRQCQEGTMRIGHPTLYTDSTPWILNFPTKDKVRADSRLEYIEQSLCYLVERQQELGVHSIAFPKLGAGLGRLSWSEVGPLMVDFLSHTNWDVYIYIAPGDTRY
ncbi:macro domain-containing protein [Dictyobacter aurantiacus]|uniref:Macro domain-containing protein n=1 Tax=Dictyobacter aurantiacus TaxID=1936993 RepID=A0A401ZFX5_9CHLR|nr:macro domain-containing protein [Dictyobacter aurantiacus]GCE05775.1 hypothetical protein KDAU_31040 [Dictyobacter aurantiacus]